MYYILQKHKRLVDKQMYLVDIMALVSSFNSISLWVFFSTLSNKKSKN